MLNMYAAIGLKIRPGIVFFFRAVDGLKISNVYLYSQCYNDKTLVL